MNSHKLRQEIKKILQSFFEPIEEAGNSMNNTFVYPYGMNQFPYDQKPKTPEELGMDANKKFDINTDDFEEYRNRDAVTVSPVFPSESVIFEKKKIDDGIICYHRSGELEHMINSDFDLTKSEDDLSVFGQAIYFSESPNISNQLGKYICKFKIKIKSPVLDMNKLMSFEMAKKFVHDFDEKYGLKSSIDLKEASDFTNVISYGEIFIALSNASAFSSNGSNNRYFKDYIISLGYNSFQYYQNFGTDFITKKGDYGVCYGIYDPNDVEYVDGPF